MNGTITCTQLCPGWQGNVPDSGWLTLQVKVGVVLVVTPVGPTRVTARLPVPPGTTMLRLLVAEFPARSIHVTEMLFAPGTRFTIDPEGGVHVGAIPLLSADPYVRVAGPGADACERLSCPIDGGVLSRFTVIAVSVEPNALEQDKVIVFGPAMSVTELVFGVVVGTPLSVQKVPAGIVVCPPTA
jgi:hypothetical protein